MNVLENQQLSKYTTFKMGGIARNLHIPETIDELTNLIENLDSDKYIFGGASNILINDIREFENVISLVKFDRSITHLENGLFRVGASTRLQELITFVNKQGYGGLEYLYSVPGLVGGAIFMNAGRGRVYNKSISDHVSNVSVFCNGQLKVLNREQCKFSYRSSIFKTYTPGSFVIMSVELQFSVMELWESERLRKERVELCKSKQDNSAPNLGSVFYEANPKIMSLFKKFPVGKCRGVRYSEKTLNWLLNYNNGSYRDAVKLIRRVELLHRILGCKCKTEVVFWD